MYISHSDAHCFPFPSANWLVDERAFFQASYPQLAQVQYALQHLLENVQRGMQMAMEIDR